MGRSEKMFFSSLPIYEAAEKTTRKKWCKNGITKCTRAIGGKNGIEKTSPCPLLCQCVSTEKPKRAEGTKRRKLFSAQFCQQFFPTLFSCCCSSRPTLLFWSVLVRWLERDGQKSPFLPPSPSTQLFPFLFSHLTCLGNNFSDFYFIVSADASAALYMLA